MPLTIFVNKKTGEPLRDPAVHARVLMPSRPKALTAGLRLSRRASLGLIIIQMILKKSLIFWMFGLTQAQPTLLFF